MAATATTGKARHLATEITGEFGNWYHQDPKQALPKGFTDRLLPHVKVTIMKQNSQGETSTSTTNTAHEGLQAIQALFQQLHQLPLTLQFNPERLYTHEPKSPHSQAHLNATGDNSTHTVRIAFKATCGVKEPKSISDVSLQIFTTRK